MDRFPVCKVNEPSISLASGTENEGRTCPWAGITAISLGTAGQCWNYRQRPTAYLTLQWAMRVGLINWNQ